MPPAKTSDLAHASSQAIADGAESQTTPAHKPAYKRLTDTDRVLILQLAKEGRTQTEIAQRLGCHQSSVSDWLAKCRDSTDQASTFLKGSALRMARNIVQTGLARDHVQVLKGIKVLEDDSASKGVSITVNGFALVGMPTFASQTSTLSQDIHRLSVETESDN